MADIYWSPPPGGYLTNTPLPAGYLLAEIGGGGGSYDASNLETLSSYATQGWLFAVGKPHFPRHDVYPGDPSYAHSAGWWTASPATDGYTIDTVPDPFLWRWDAFTTWKNAQTNPPYPVPNDWQPHYLSGFFGYARGDINPGSSDLNYLGVTIHAGTMSLPSDSVLSIVGSEPFSGTPFSFRNPNHRLNRPGYYRDYTKIQMVVGQAHGNAYTAYLTGFNGLQYPYVVYDNLDFWYPEKLYYLYQVLADPDGAGSGNPNPPYTLQKHVRIDAPSWFDRPGGNKVAWGKSDMSSLTTGTTPVAQVAQVGVYRPAIKDATDRGNPGVFLDTSVVEAEATNAAGGKYAVPAGCNPIWLPSGALVAIYRTRGSSSGAWAHWWRINWMSGEQNGQPPISAGAMGNWSARQAITLPTSVWCQMTRGQGKIVALYNTGSVLYTPTSNTYARTAGNLYAMYALDPLCKTWSAPILLASGVLPLAGGLCYTGESWVACYTRNSDLVSLCKRSFNLTDWTGAAATPTNLTANSQALHCYGLCYARDSLQGVWSPYADTPGSANMGGYLSVYSGDQGRTWQVAQPTARLGTALTMDGDATVCQEMAVLQKPGYTPAMQYSDTNFRLTNGVHTIP